MERGRRNERRVSEKERERVRELLTSNSSMVFTDESYTFNLKNGFFLTFWILSVILQAYGHGLN